MITFDLKNGWRKSDFEFEMSDNSQKTYLDAGFKEVCMTPKEVDVSFFCATVYAFDASLGAPSLGNEYLVLLNVGDTKEIMVSDLPSLIELLSKISPINVCALLKESEAEKVHDWVQGEVQRSGR